MISNIDNYLGKKVKVNLKSGEVITGYLFKGDTLDKEHPYYNDWLGNGYHLKYANNDERSCKSIKLLEIESIEEIVILKRKKRDELLLHKRLFSPERSSY